MLKAELIERSARFRSLADDAGRNPAECPTLVLNADYTPLSYYPLSLWPWQTAIKAVFLDRVDIVENYDLQVHSPLARHADPVGHRAEAICEAR